MKYEIWLTHQESETHFCIATCGTRSEADSFIGAQPELDGLESYEIKEIAEPKIRPE